MEDTQKTAREGLGSFKEAASTQNTLHAHPRISSSPPQARKASPSLQRTKSFNSKSKASSPSNSSTFYIGLPPAPKRQKTRNEPLNEKIEGRKSKYFDSRNSSLGFASSSTFSSPQTPTSTPSALPVASSSTHNTVERSTRRSSRLSKKEKGNEEANSSSEKEIILAQPVRRETLTKPVKKRRIRTKAPPLVASAQPASFPTQGTSSSASREAYGRSLDQAAERAENFSRSPCPSPTLIELKLEVTDKASSSRFELLTRSATVYTEPSTPATATHFSHSVTPAPSSSLGADLLSVAPDFYLTSNSFLQLDFLAPLLLSLRLRSFSALRDLPACILRSYLDHAQTNYETQGSPQGVIKTEDWKRMKDLLCNVLIEREGTSKKFFDTVLF
ncbi:hypothetical protein JCM5350_000434 [Sporobolomyces pararoseus]